MLNAKKTYFLIIGIICITAGSLFFVYGRVVGENVSIGYDAQGKRNPFIPLITSNGRFLKLDREESTSKSQEIVIEGLIYDKRGRSFAIINAQVVGVGDPIGDYQLLKIFEDRVVLAKEGKILEVEFKKEE